MLTRYQHNSAPLISNERATYNYRVIQECYRPDSKNMPCGFRYFT